MSSSHHHHDIVPFKPEFKTPSALHEFSRISLENRLADMEKETEKVNSALIDFYLWLVSTQTKQTNMEREKERMEKLPASIIFDYLKGLVYKLQNEHDELKIKF